MLTCSVQIRLKQKAWMKFKITQTDSEHFAYIKCNKLMAIQIAETMHYKYYTIHVGW